MRWIDEEGHRIEFDRVARYVATRSPEELVKVRDTEWLGDLLTSLW